MIRHALLPALLLAAVFLYNSDQAFSNETEEVVINYPQIAESIPEMTQEEIIKSRITVPGRWQTLLWAFAAGVIVLSLSAKKPRQKAEDPV